MDTQNRVDRREVPVPVDDLTIVLGLLGLVCTDHADDDQVAGIASRTADRLRRRIAEEIGEADSTV